MLQTTLGASAVLAQPGDRRLCILNSLAAWLWEARQAGYGVDQMAQLLAARFALTEDEARTQVEAMVGHWDRAGLLGEPGPDAMGGPAAVPRTGRFPAQRQPDEATPVRYLRLGDRQLGLAVDDVVVAARLAKLLGSPGSPSDAAVSHTVHLAGTAEDWTLWLDAEPSVSGTGADAALVETFHALCELASAAEERLIVLHGAGLVVRERIGVALIGQGGAGKTTLATALNAAGHVLLSDDVVPVNAEGKLVGLGSSICLKPGSWPVLAPLRPDLDTAEPLLRFGERVRYLPPAGPAPEAPVPLRLFLFPNYRPDAEPALTPLSPESVLHGIVTAEAVIRHLTQDKLDALARWVASAPAFELVYPDLDSALELVEEALGAVP